LYFLGVAYYDLGETDKALKAWKKAAVGLNEISAAVFYNDQQPDIIFYQGLALKKLGNEQEAERCFKMLIDYGCNHMNDRIEIDYFAVSLPDLLIWEDNLDMRNKLLCKYLMGLGFLGLGEKDRAENLFNEVLHEDKAHLNTLKHIHKALMV
jgi:tetratricopeptide (TPR) repeat protein